MVLTGWASLLAVFAVEFLSLLYLGTLGEEAILAAVGLGSMTLFTVMSVSIGVTVGGAAMVSRALGAGDGQGARRLGGASLILMTAATAVAGCCIWRSSVRMPPPSAWSRGCAAICCPSSSFPHRSWWRAGSA